MTGITLATFSLVSEKKYSHIWCRYFCGNRKSVSLCSFFSCMPCFSIFLSLLPIYLLYSSKHTCCTQLVVLFAAILPYLVLPKQVFWGQEHLNCLMLMEEHLCAYLNLQNGDAADSCSTGKACHTQPPPSPVSPSPRTEHSSDDLRTGNFQYIQDSGELLLNAH